MRSPQTIRMFLSGDLDFLQLSCPATLLVSAYDIKRNQCPGLLTLAHQRGLQALRVTWTHNDAELSLAHAVATFPFGTFADCGDASPSSVTKAVALHFRRVACTRAAARALRLALGVEVCSVEELA